MSDVPQYVERCLTHHHACDCREWHFKALEEENQRLRNVEKAAQAVVDMPLALDHYTAEERDKFYALAAALGEGE